MKIALLKPLKESLFFAFSSKMLCCLCLLNGLFFGSSFVAEAQEKKKFRVVVDAGHGGKDPGSEASDPKKFFHEKDIVLNVAKKLQYYLENNIEGIEVVMTRRTDTFLSLEERTELANQEQADLFISLHCNSNPLTYVHGVQLHVQDYRFKNSLWLAHRLNEEFGTRAKRKTFKIQTTGDRQHNLYVLQYTKMPAVLIEMGFLSHPEEEKFLNSEYGQILLASAIFRAIRSYQKHKYRPK
ncbi:N-acetylmuramoyl-L-alanine amidase family protein [Hugenholtzia roseola]|uniref:N-acetylmuramoyl-L-alanine amidase family protein n=1 Tax=Hugenholtzia roseola TaxID=1002 RepID=UPI00040DE23A|nr:N-acetylmuramoyl-L-alanine amidase [Hugenholtzia roseola]